MGKIAASWVISPVLGGVIAAIFLYVIKSQIIFKEDRLSSAKKVVPILVSLMAAAFITYLTVKGLKKVWPVIVDTLSFLPQTKKPTFLIALMFGGIGAVITFVIVKPRIAKRVIGMEATRESFAHGANDVANAVGPLAAVYDALTTHGVSTKAAIPLWVMVVGGLGISIGLALFGPRLIKTVGSEITELDQMRAFSIMMAASITVVIASQLGLPVSSTHIAVGAIFGVGFLREWLDSKNMGEKQEKLKVEVEKQNSLKNALADLKTDEDYKRQIELMESLKVQKKRVKSLKRTLRENYVKRGMVKKIVAAWIITVPAAAVLSGIIFFVLKGFAV
jgi:PiT family inorganic phosphate transporter